MKKCPEFLRGIFLIFDVAELADVVWCGVILLVSHLDFITFNHKDSTPEFVSVLIDKNPITFLEGFGKCWFYCTESPGDCGKHEIRIHLCLHLDGAQNLDDVVDLGNRKLEIAVGDVALGIDRGHDYLAEKWLTIVHDWADVYSMASTNAVAPGVDEFFVGVGEHN